MLVTVVSVLTAVTVDIMLRTVKMMTVCSVREQPEVRACETRIAAMFDSATSRTVAEPPRVVGQKRCTWRTQYSMLEEKTRRTQVRRNAHNPD